MTLLTFPLHHFLRFFTITLIFFPLRFFLLSRQAEIEFAMYLQIAGTLFLFVHLRGKEPNDDSQECMTDHYRNHAFD
jgi:hypothetical protein